MKCKRGEVWLVNLDPTIGSEIKKSRPAIIIQNDIGNEHSPITIIAPLTSQGVERIYPIEVAVKSKKLKKDSKALLNQIRAIDKQRLIKRIDLLEKSTMTKVDEAIRISLSL